MVGGSPWAEVVGEVGENAGGEVAIRGGGGYSEGDEREETWLSSVP